MSLFCKSFVFLFVLCVLCGCNKPNKHTSTTGNNIDSIKIPEKIRKDTVIVDSNYTFEEAIAGSKAPSSVIEQLELVTVKYYSTDHKIHEGQVLTNKKIAAEIVEIFDFMLQEKFPVAKAIPIVYYDWNDEKSMEDNNTYSFCYRNIGYSFHSDGMAIDINPLFNPLRWKAGFEHRPNQPQNSVYNTDIPGTLYDGHPVIEKFTELGFRWGRHFKQKADDHHFEKGPIRVRPKVKGDSISSR